MRCWPGIAIGSTGLFAVSVEGTIILHPADDASQTIIITLWIESGDRVGSTPAIEAEAVTTLTCSHFNLHMNATVFHRCVNTVLFGRVCADFPWATAMLEGPGADYGLFTNGDYGIKAFLTVPPISISGVNFTGGFRSGSFFDYETVTLKFGNVNEYIDPTSNGIGCLAVRQLLHEL